MSARILNEILNDNRGAHLGALFAFDNVKKPSICERLESLFHTITFGRFLPCSEKDFIRKFLIEKGISYDKMSDVAKRQADALSGLAFMFLSRAKANGTWL